ncbi:MAG: deoxynucleoside kinase [Bacteroidales bacterium]|jgi:deoxyadenosine/deoxycytidine kinase|nr:deoxynucleoside kinase [Bacteroidales bacterium]MBQ1719865.1 deoxynucleoside kinase [Bacteroidales bacterium]MBQ2076194.1 deoxynucleoside kinase [Bacteroidales bacterium]MBQ2350928.1 deoxynucleoside kinase [Bacteroidales bacterium]MBQ2542245.1 deoxynucleoside kinase [Bacteroidales bacterium]
MDIRYLVIEGNIGAGKTSLSKLIAERKKGRLFLEQYAENPFLPKFYENPERYSFPLELSFLADRYNQLKNNLSSFDLFNELIVSDYFFMKSLIFSAHTLQEDEYRLYRQLFDIIYSTLPKPDLYIYLHKNIDLLLKNISKRGREYEKNISAEYLKGIETGYFNFFKQQNQMRIVVIDTNNIDFVNNEEDLKKIENSIFDNEYPVGITRIIL